MAKAKRKRVSAGAEPARTAPAESALARWRHLRVWRAAALLAFAVLIFYWIPLTDPNTSIQWDAVDTHYSPQKYFADHVREGEIPYWTPYIFSGFPFLADPQVGAWYPLNWPFFLTGITPRVIQVEIAVHAFLACLGAFLLLVRVVPNRQAALIGGLTYAFSGYFADHSSHVGMFSVASLLPWLLLCFHIALERSPVCWTALGGLAGGAIILAGHFQNALYSFAAAGLFGIALIIEQPRRWSRAAVVLAGILVLALGLSAIQTLPGLELTRNSLRRGADYSKTHERILKPDSLLKLILPIANDPISQRGSKGSALPDANFYLYGGVLLLPLAVLGLRNRAVRVSSLLLIVLPVWYMLGPDAGLYRVGALLPGFHRVRAPIHFWFVTALGLAILAASGAAWVFERWHRDWLPFVLAALILTDLFYWNSYANIYAYARHGFDDLYGNKERVAQAKVLPVMAPLTRYDAPDLLTVFGPLNHPLDLRLEATYGYNPLQLSAYAEYRDAMKVNPKLRSGLNVSHYLDVEAGAVVPNSRVLPRAYFARQILSAQDARESLRLLQLLDPSQATIVLGSMADVQPAPDAVADVSSDGEQAYRVHYKAAATALLKLSVPYFPGWRATADGTPCPIKIADHALMGIVVPGGERNLLVEFHSDYFRRGAILSTASLVLALCILLWPIAGKLRQSKIGV